MIADSFDSRTLARMEVALDRACKLLDTGAEQHKTRRHIAGKFSPAPGRAISALTALPKPDGLRPTKSAYARRLRDPPVRRRVTRRGWLSRSRR